MKSPEKVRRSLVINFAQNHSIMVVQFVSSIILARLLSPSDIGIYSVAATLIALAQTVRDFGVGQYIIQEKELTKDRIRAAFGLALIVATTLATVTALLSPFAAEYYREEVVRNVMLLLAANFLLIPFGQITMAYLQREMQFTKIAVVKLFSALVHSISAIVLAYLEFKSMSLAWASIAGTFTSVVLVALIRPKELPLLPGLREIRRVLGFGSFSVLGNLSGAVAKGIPDLVIGRMMNMASVGFYSRANSLIEIFNQAVMTALWSVAMPHFAKAARTGGDLRADYLSSAAMITGLAWPFFGVMAILAEPVILVLYGYQWVESIPLVKWICLAFWIVSPFYLFSSIMIGIGRIKINTWFELGTLPVQLVLYLIAGFIGILEIVAIANVGFACVRALFAYHILRRELGFGLQDFLNTLWRSAVITMFAGAGCLIALIASSTFHSPLLDLAAGGIGALLAWLISGYWLKHPLAAEVLAIQRRLLRKE